MNVQQYIEQAYREHLEETVGQGYDAKNPVDFIDGVNVYEMAGEPWFFEDSYKALEDFHEKRFGTINYNQIGTVIDGMAMIALKKVDLGHLYDIASDYADERNGERL